MLLQFLSAWKRLDGQPKWIANHLLFILVNFNKRKTIKVDYRGIKIRTMRNSLAFGYPFTLVMIGGLSVASYSRSMHTVKGSPPVYQTKSTVIKNHSLSTTYDTEEEAERAALQIAKEVIDLILPKV